MHIQAVLQNYCKQKSLFHNPLKSETTCLLFYKHVELEAWCHREREDGFILRIQVTRIHELNQNPCHTAIRDAACFIGNKHLSP